MYLLSQMAILGIHVSFQGQKKQILRFGCLGFVFTFSPFRPSLISLPTLFQSSGQVLHFHVMQLDGQVFLWIGGEQKGFDDACLSLVFVYPHWNTLKKFKP